MACVRAIGLVFFAVFVLICMDIVEAKKRKGIRGKGNKTMSQSGQSKSLPSSIFAPTNESLPLGPGLIGDYQPSHERRSKKVHRNFSPGHTAGYTPYPGKLWDGQCGMLGSPYKALVEECLNDCTNDDECTAANYNEKWHGHSTCVLWECSLPVPEPLAESDDWTGYVYTGEQAPTTEALTTSKASTEAATSKAPTTEAPTTSKASTEAATSKAPTTEAPTTSKVSTEASTSKAPTTEVATTVVSTEAPDNNPEEMVNVQKEKKTGSLFLQILQKIV